MNEENLPPKPKFNLKYILIVAILAALAGGGIFTYTEYINKQLTSFVKLPEIKKDETADWRTYQDINEGWGIKLPVSYFFYSKIEPKEQLKKQLEREDRVIRGDFYSLGYFSFAKYLDKPFSRLAPFGGDKPAIEITLSKIEKKPSDISMFDYVNDVLAKPTDSGFFEQKITPIRNVKKIEVSKRPIITGELFVFESCFHDGYWIEKDKESYIEISIAKCYSVENLNSSESRDKLFNITNEINQILSFFKFIK